MNETLPSSSDWMQFYQQTVDTSSDFADAANTLTASSCATSISNKLSPSGSFVAASDHLTPTGSISKPIRKRSRASKRTPTTLLNADSKNFRSLVQQFTGCRRRSTSISFGKPRGPVSINFSLGKKHDYRSTDHASISQPLVGNNICSGQSQLQQQDQEHQLHYQQEQASNEEQEGELSLESITADDFDLLTSYCCPRSGSEIPQGFGMDDLYFLA
ncbi:hypothetical protein DITRI_Ditri01bG0003500 [Diplodiscus trichospermus]